ncbi:MAG: segregation/condensation protein A, partial [Candidatus Altiarchaeota archaeon]|nr:segregation/condensation protein A [Candidatus Altiarchaeota archaeon]
MDLLDIAMMDLNKVEPRIFGLIDGGDIDPWDIDISNLCDMYVGEIRSRRDMRISGNALLTAAVLLRVKSKIFDEKVEKAVEKKPELLVPDIEIVPVARKIERKVTVFELLDALN